MTTSLLVLVIASAGVQGQSKNRDWSRVEAIGPGVNLMVELNSGQLLRGAVVRIRPEEMTLADRGGAEITTARGNVKHVRLKSRGRGAVIGLLVGFGAGLASGAIAGPYIVDHGNPSAGARFRHGAGWGAVFGGAGALIGAATGANIRIY